MTTWWRHTARELANSVARREVSAEEVTASALARLDAVNGAINAVVRQMPEEALEMARAVDRRIAAGEDPGPLAGVPVTIKENVDQAGQVTSNGLRIQRELRAGEDNPVVANLRRAGAVFIGRTNTPAFSLRWFTRNSLFGHTRNPCNRALTPGGSSGGAAAAVASGIGAIAHGTDIGGSVRYPAYACGVHGLRPSFGRVPAANFTAPDRHVGAQLMAVSGPLARSVDDLRLALGAMSARDVRDPWWVPAPLSAPARPRRVALTIAPDGMSVDDAVADALRAAAARLVEAGWTVEEVPCPPLREAARLQLLLWLTEFRRAGAQMVEREDDPDACFVYRCLDSLCPPTGVNDLLDALQARVGLVRQWQLFLERYPLWLAPVSGELPFPDLLDVASEADFERVFKAQLVQVGLPLLGLPGLTVSTGRVGDAPVGVQLVAGRFEEDHLLTAGAVLENGQGPVPPVDPAA